jgi:hypothetical protein
MHLAPAALLPTSLSPKPVRASFVRTACTLLFTFGCSAGGGGAALESPSASTSTDTPPAPSASSSPATGLGLRVFEAEPSCDPTQAGRSPLRRLSLREYAHSVEDLLGQPAPASALEVQDTLVAGFKQNSLLVLSPTNAQRYLSAAETLAANAILGFPALSGCSSSADTACARAFVEGLAQRAFRGAFGESDAERLRAAFADPDLSSDSRLALALELVLLSPKFLYTLPLAAELAPAGSTATPLAPKVVAGRLALALWKSVPDAAQVGANAELPDARVLARAMLSDPRAQRGFEAFVEEWLALESTSQLRKSAELFPEFASVAPHLLPETHAFFSNLVASSGSLSELLQAPYSWVNAPLAELYGIPSPASTGFSRVELPLGRLGIFAQASFLAHHAHPEKASPVKRGVVLRERLLCDPVAPPPPGISTEVNVEAGQPAAGAFAAHASQPACAVCHRYIDPLGNGLNQFDAIGRYLPNALAEGEIVTPVAGADPTLSGAFSSLSELTAKLASSEQVAQCLTLQVQRFLLGRLEQAEDACALTQLYREVQGQGVVLEDLFLRSLSTPLFLTRASVKEQEP